MISIERIPLVKKNKCDIKSNNTTCKDKYVSHAEDKMINRSYHLNEYHLNDKYITKGLKWYLESISVCE